MVLVGFLGLHSILGKHIYASPPMGVGDVEARSGAQLMYYGGDYIDLVLIVLFCLDWYRRTAPTRGMTSSMTSSSVARWRGGAGA